MTTDRGMTYNLLLLYLSQFYDNNEQIKFTHRYLTWDGIH